MGSRKKLITGLAVAEILIALSAVLIPWLVFPVCEGHGHCHYSFVAETGTSASVAAAAVMSIVSRGMEAPRLMSVVTAVGGVFMILFPSALIGVCETTMMACHYGDLPVWNLLGAGLIIISIAVFLAAKEEGA